MLESIYVRIDLHPLLSEQDKDAALERIYSSLAGLVRCSAIHGYRVLTDEDPLPPHF